jgi:hypothetical protein
MKIDCTECGARVLAEDVDLPTKMAKCRACNAVFPIDSAAPAPAPRRARPPRPEGLQIFSDAPALGEPGYRDAPGVGGQVRIVRRWFSPQFIFLLFFCIAWDAFLVFWYANATKGGGGFTLIAVVFPIAHVAAGVGLTYYTLAGFLNHTTFALDASHFSIQHAPLPWKGSRRIPRGDIVQLYCEEVVSQGKNGPSSAFYLSAVLTGDIKLRLASMPLDQAKYLEAELEERLGLVNEIVPGQVGS